ncbi:putative glutathione s-transferase parc [Quercus suber]|uniref:Glutathione S-transferase n=1 Tax=Quercus suber TaxID=58331 RepID=A0AAW0M241_QUESU
MFNLCGCWVYVASRKVWRPKVEEQEEGKKEYLETLKTMEGELGDKPYFGGENFGYVDISLIPFYSWFHAYKVLDNINFEAECPKIIAWAKRCMQKQTVAKNFPDQKKVYEFVAQTRKKDISA